MESTKFQTSFIPKRTTIATAPYATAKSSAVSFFNVIAIVVFLSTIAGAVGVFAFKGLLANQIVEKRAMLEKAQGAFEPDFIKKMVRLNDRITHARELLDNHVAVSPLFEVIENSTLRTVRFKDFKYFLEDAQSVKLTMRGEARNFASIVLQSDQFGKNKYLRDQLFADFNLDQVGNVGFTFTAGVDRSLVSHKNTLNTLSIFNLFQ